MPSELKLASCATLESERLSPAELGDEVRYVGLEHMDSDTPRLRRFASVRRVSGQVTPFHAGDVLFGRLRPYLKKVALAHFGGVCSPEILVLRPVSQVVTPEYLVNLLASERVIQYAVAHSAGSRMPRVSAADLGRLTVNPPTIEAQSQLTGVTSSLDIHLDALAAELSALLDLQEAARSRLREQKETVTLAALAAPNGVQIGPFGSQLKADEYVDTGVPVVMPQDIADGLITTQKIKRVAELTANRLAKHRLRAGDIVFPRRGDLKRRALVQSDQEGWLCGTGCLRFRPRDASDAEAIFESLAGDEASDWLEAHAVGTTMLNLNTAIISSMPVPTPTPTTRAYIELAMASTREVPALRAEITEMRQLRSGVRDNLLKREGLGNVGIL